MKGFYFHSGLCSFLLGVGLQTLFSFSLATITWCFLLVWASALYFYKERTNLPFRQTVLLLLTGTLFSIGLLRMEVATWKYGHSPLASALHEEMMLQGVVIREPDIRERTQYLDVKIGEDILRVSTDVFVPVSYGDTVAVRGEIETPDTFITDLGREFHYDTYLLAKGIEYTMSFAEVTVVSSDNGNHFISFLLSLKSWILNGIEMSLGEPQAGLGAGLLLGVKQALGDDIEEVFRKAGIIHIVVLSGYNIMLIVAFMMFVVSSFLGRRLRVIVGLVGVVGFALMVGLSATVVRASIMASLLLIASALGRTYDVLRALLLAGSVMVFLNPYLLLYDIGFQLSFMATLGLVLFVPRFESLLANRGHATLREYLLATVATQIAVLPLLLYHIGEISLVSVVVNVLVLPFVPIAMLATFVSAVLAAIFPFGAIPFTLLAHFTLTYIIAVATWFASVPLAAVAVPAFPAIFVPIMYLMMAIGYLYFIRKEKQPESEWVVEDEEDKEKAGGELRPPPAQTDVPLFFR